jgi:hypothetical protein
MTSLPISDVPSSRYRYSAIIDNQKNEYNFETVHVKQEIYIEDYRESLVKLSTGDVTSCLARLLAAEVGKFSFIDQ